MNHCNFFYTKVKKQITFQLLQKKIAGIHANSTSKNKNNMLTRHKNQAS